MSYHFTSARELFEAAREASRDAERIRRQLVAMEERAEGLGGGGFEPRVRSTGEPDRMGSRVATMVDVERRLRERQEQDYAIIDLASAVLYGTDNDAGLWALVSWRADAIFHHYLGGMTWAQVGDMLGYSEQYVWQQAQVALDTCDGWGLLAVMAGTGRAEE
ncbi:MAG: hypothetical protein IJ781_13190 [Atopobiaceae bacterium]|nr:hypothetical protein [Atopobiaceae bacterium]